MSKPIRQHFIPQSYLRNFALNEGDKYFVEIKQKGFDDIKEKISVKDICVEKNIYTIQGIETDKKYDLEKFYASNVDSVYPEVYKLLTDPETVTINEEQKKKILLTITSLFFRTPKFLNLNNKNTNDIFDHLAKYADKSTGEVNYKFGGKDFSFNVRELESVKQEAQLKNKERFLINHLADWDDFVNFKMECGIGVTKIVDDINLITSDNPVAIRAVKTNYWEIDSIFDANNMIQAPLDSKHFLYIFPNSEKKLNHTFWRSEGKLWNALTCNNEMEQLAEKWILGYPGTIKEHILNDKKYNTATEENNKAVEDEKQRVLLLQELYTMQEHLTFYDPLVIEKIIQFSGMHIFKGNPVIEESILKYKSLGIIKEN